MCGRLFYAIPICLLPDLIPLRIDVLIPDQEQYPPELRRILHSDFSVPMRHPRLENLGISRHICRALDYHCAQHPDFLSLYHTLPFGSRLQFENISANVKDMTLTVLPAHYLERQWLSVSSLQALWFEEVRKSDWPQTIDLGQLRLKKQLHDSVSVVSLAAESGHGPDKDLVFKSTTTDPKFVYHELKFLLAAPRHANLMRPPIYIVTKKCNFGGKHGVCGFILPYYLLGSIRDVLPMRTHTDTLTLRQRLTWSRQIACALIHIREAAGTFYSDLRPDNVLLSIPMGEGSEDIILCDFEQRGNWYEWCAPEILYSMYMENLSTSPFPAAQKYLWDCNLRSHLPTKAGPHGCNAPWFSLSPDAQEKSMVFSLGLLLYCIFEGLSNVRNSLANAWPYEPEIAFPEFRRTPPFMQNCIRQCTIDAPEWELETERSKPGTQVRRIWRINGQLFPGRKTCDEGETVDPAQTVLETAKAWWESELQRAKIFFQSDDWRTGRCGRARPTLREVLAILDGEEAI